MKAYLISAILMLGPGLAAQEGSAPKEGKDTTYKSENWTVLNPDGSIEFSGEVARLLEDADYRASIYHSKYKLEQVPELISQKKVMQALWTMINLYDENPDKVKTMVFLLGRRGIRGQHYLSAFYTYIFADPEVMHFGENEAFHMDNPMVMEEKLEACKELSGMSEAIAVQYQASK